MELQQEKQRVRRLIEYHIRSEADAHDSALKSSLALLAKLELSGSYVEVESIFAAVQNHNSKLARLWSELTDNNKQ